MKNTFYFGEKLEQFNVRVLNEREIRAGSGILFVFALIAFIESWANGNFNMTKIFVVVFIIEFIIRIFINSKYAPSLILGRFFTRNQKPEYVGAPQKKFAWSIGFGLSLLMFINLILMGSIGPVNFLICILCLIFLFFETSFGVCLGCKLYNFFNKKQAELCPGGVCEVVKKDEIQKISTVQVIVLVLFVTALVFVVNVFNGKNKRELVENQSTSINIESCSIPDWVKKIGHEEKYKLHHDC